MNPHGNPLRPKKEQKFTEPIKKALKFPKSEAKKILATKVPLTAQHTQWVQRWLQNRIESYCLPPQFAGPEAFSQMSSVLSPPDFESLLGVIRKDFGALTGTLPSSNVEEESSSEGEGGIALTSTPTS
jgi:hypothetical protein